MSWARIMAPLSGGKGDVAAMAAAAVIAEPFGAELAGVYTPADVADVMPWMGEGFLGGVQTTALESLKEATSAGEANARKALESVAYQTRDLLDAMTMQVEVAARRGDSAGVDAGLRQLQAKHPKALSTLLTAGHVAMTDEVLRALLAEPCARVLLLDKAMAEGLAGLPFPKNVKRIALDDSDAGQPFSEWIAPVGTKRRRTAVVHYRGEDRRRSASSAAAEQDSDDGDEAGSGDEGGLKRRQSHTLYTCPMCPPRADGGPRRTLQGKRNTRMHFHNERKAHRERFVRENRRLVEQVLAHGRYPVVLFAGVETCLGCKRDTRDEADHAGCRAAFSAFLQQSLGASIETEGAGGAAGGAAAAARRG